MNYLFQYKFKLPIALCLLLLSSNVAAELKPYSAVYNFYLKGFYIGESTQNLTKNENLWEIVMSTQAKGLASFMKPNPIVERQTFKIEDSELHLLTAEYEDQNKSIKIVSKVNSDNNELKIKLSKKNKTLKFNQPLYSYLLMPIKAGLEKNSTPQNITVFDKKKIKKLLIKTAINENKVVRVFTNQSNKRVEYSFNNTNEIVPYRIERFNKHKSMFYLQLTHLNGEKITLKEKTQTFDEK